MPSDYRSSSTATAIIAHHPKSTGQSWLTSLGLSWIQRAARGKPSWPEPILSIGLPCEPLHSISCWDVKGPARDIALSICPKVASLLESSREELTEGESHCPLLLVRMYMVGQCKNEAIPVLVVSCGKKRIREKARTLIKEMKLLDDHPALVLIASSKVPTLLAGPTLDLPKSVSAFEAPSGVQSDFQGNEKILVRASSQEAHAVPLYFCMSSKPSVLIGGRATMGGLICVNGVLRGLSAAHVLQDDEKDEKYDLDDSDDTDIEYDCDDSEENNYVDITSTGSITSDTASDFTREHDLSSSNPSPGSSHEPESEDNLSGQITEIIGSSEKKSRPRRPSFTPVALESELIQVGSIYAFSKASSSGYMDWSLVDLEDSYARMILERIITYVQQMPEAIDRGFPTHLVDMPDKEVEVLLKKGSSSRFSKGWLSGTPSSVMMRGSTVFQTVWGARFEDTIEAGESGSWVIDSQTGSLYGHLFAGEPGTRSAYVIPAMDIFRDIQQQVEGPTELLSLTQTIENLTRRLDPHVSIDQDSSSANTKDLSIRKPDSAGTDGKGCVSEEVPPILSTNPGNDQRNQTKSCPLCIFRDSTSTDNEMIREMICPKCGVRRITRSDSTMQSPVKEVESTNHKALATRQSKSRPQLRKSVSQDSKVKGASEAYVPPTTFRAPRHPSPLGAQADLTRTNPGSAASSLERYPSYVTLSLEYDFKKKHFNRPPKLSIPIAFQSFRNTPPIDKSGFTSTYQDHLLCHVEPEAPGRKRSWVRAAGAGPLAQGLTQDEVKTMFSKSKKNRLPLSEQYSQLSPEMRGRIHRLIEDCVTADPDPMFEYKLAELNTGHTLFRGKETPSMHLILKRQLCPDLEPRHNWPEDSSGSEHDQDTASNNGTISTQTTIRSSNSGGSSVRSSNSGGSSVRSSNSGGSSREDGNKNESGLRLDIVRESGNDHLDIREPIYRSHRRGLPRPSIEDARFPLGTRPKITYEPRAYDYTTRSSNQDAVIIPARSSDLYGQRSRSKPTYSIDSKSGGIPLNFAPPMAFRPVFIEGVEQEQAMTERTRARESRMELERTRARESRMELDRTMEIAGDSMIERAKRWELEERELETMRERFRHEERELQIRRAQEMATMDKRMQERELERRWQETTHMNSYEREQDESKYRRARRSRETGRSYSIDEGDSSYPIIGVSRSRSDYGRDGRDRRPEPRYWP